MPTVTLDQGLLFFGGYDGTSYTSDVYKLFREGGVFKWDTLDYQSNGRALAIAVPDLLKVGSFSNVMIC